MGKIADPSLKPGCVHCGNKRTPLWRAGPDGLKTLCNACGVRYTRGKLAIYEDSDGNRTAVRPKNETAVHSPPAPEKSDMNIITASDPPSASHNPHAPSQPDSIAGRPTRRVPSEVVASAVLANNTSSGSCRTNAGQLPGKNSSKAGTDDVTQWNSPLRSPKSYSPPPAGSPQTDVGALHAPERNGAPSIVTYREGGCPLQSSGTSSLTIDDPLPYQCNPSDEALFPDASCLGIDFGDDDGATVNLLPMAADPSSAEKFSLPFPALGNYAAVNEGLLDSVEALRGLVLDRKRRASACYDSTVVALCRLCDERRLRSQSTEKRQPWTIEDCKNYVRWFAQEQNVGLVTNKPFSGNPGNGSRDSNGMDIKAGIMLPERIAYSSAVESLKALLDSTELAGFAEGCIVELLCEDVALAPYKGGLADHSKAGLCRLSDAYVDSIVS